MFIRTPRLLLRPGWPEDAGALTAAIAHRDVAERLARLPWPYRLDDAIAWLTAPKAAGDVDMLVMEVTRGVPVLAGGIGLRMVPGGLHELGLWITPAAQGRGIATEAGEAVIAMARDSLRLPMIEAAHFHDNPASGRVLTKLGFVATGETITVRSLARGADVPAARYTCDLARANKVQGVPAWSTEPMAA